ncbi:MAG: glycoside hydrolase family 3 protein [Chloroflexi bacterium]|nr:glycoside hydrolase family 3 protein [Chloroflexota bacterium]MCY4246796.1 glycoside hydrolase family 3 protein [Chloroflexota bacterium]
MNTQSTIASMTIEEKVGQMFMLAFASDQLDEARILMGEHLVGGAYISDENVPGAAAALRLCNTLQSFARGTRLGIPLLLGADQEGTWSVMTAESAMGPGNMALGATGDPDCAYRMYGMIARELMAVGMNVVLGPAADCNSNPHNSIIGMRSFGEEPALVAEMTAAAVRGVQDAGSVATLKHFPGHGDTRLDSHRGLSTVHRSREELLKIDLAPFAAGIAAGAKIVMTSHIIFSALDPVRPATLSPIILDDLLRGELGFAGLVVSDSMNMHAMKRNYAPADAVIQGFNAGVDLMMLAEEHYDHDASQYLANQRALIGDVIAAVKSGRIAMSRVDEAVARILRLKNEAGFSTAELPETTLVGCEEHRASERQLARRAISIIRDRHSLLPLDPSAPLMLVNTTLRSAYPVLTKTRGIGPNQAAPAFDVFVDALRAACPNARVVAAEDFSSADLPAQSLIIAVTENYTLPGMDFDRSQQAPIVRALQERAGERLLVLALCEPYELAEFPEIAGYVCAFSFRPCAALAAADVLLGRAAATGTTPVSVPGTELSASQSQKP